MWLLLISMLLPAHAEPGASEQAWPMRAGHQLPQKEGLYLRWDRTRSYGSNLIVQTLAEVGERLAFERPNDEPLLIGDLSQRGGGHMYGHITHNLGVDADIGLYTGQGKQPLGGFLDVRSSDLDLDATWALIRALLDTDKVAFILLDQSHIDALREHLLVDLQLDADVVDPIFPEPDVRLPWDSRGVVRHAPEHSSHLHVRITYATGT